MSKQLNRRQFLKAGGAGAVSLAFAPLLVEPARVTAPKSRLPQRVLQAATQAPFTALPSTLPLGQPLADISMGWDGSVWGIDSDGVPHHYDQLAQAWQVYGSGFDAVGLLPDASTVVARGAEVSIDGAMPTSITSIWSKLPDSFAAGLDGIATAQNTLFLLRHGRFIAIDPATKAPYDAPKWLSGWIKGWPTTTPAWQAGAITAIGSNPRDTNDPRLTVWTKDEYIVVDMANATVVHGPRLISTIAGDALGTIMAQGFDAVLVDPDNPGDSMAVFQGPLHWSTANTGGTPVPSYAGDFSSSWAPTLAHAPSGRTGTLWAATTDNDAVQHDGDSWQVVADPDGIGLGSLTAGTDGAVFGLTVNASPQQGVLQRKPDGSGWDLVAFAPSSAVQLTASDADHVWVRTAQNTVARLNGTGFSAVSLGHAATHIAAASDGTLWHAAGSANAYRFISEGRAPSAAVAVGSGIAQLTHVAATGFGTAFVLATPATSTPGATPGPQLYSYDSLYAFKTAAAYTPQFDYFGLSQSIALAGHTMFLASSTAQGPLESSCKVVALDAQTGAELWPTPFPVPITIRDLGVADVVLAYDAALALVYVTGGGYLYAVDAATGTQVWRLDMKLTNLLPALVGPLALNNGRLLVGDIAHATVSLIDTADALARAKAGQQPVPRWTASVPYDTGGLSMPWIGTPAFDTGGTLYLATQDDDSGQGWLTALRSADGARLWSRALVGPGFGFTNKPVLDTLLGQVIPTGATQPADTVLVNFGSAVVAVEPSTGTTLHSFGVPTAGGNYLSSGMSYHDNRLYFGDTNGTLYVLDALRFQLLTKTADAKQPSWQGVLSRPAVIHSDDATDGVAVYFSRGDASVWVFDPATNNLAQVTTDQTRIAALAYDNAHGLLYACSWNGPANGGSLGQLFALRPDQAIQDARAFIIESQLLQDYASDAEAAGNGVARYQTHVTIVDSNHVGIAKQAVKLWADEDGTAVSVDGTAFTIGPTTPAVFATDASGAFTLTSDAQDLQTTTLSLWAAFMDVHERIAIVPDAEFHGRLAATSASGSTDPQQVDTVSAQSYDGVSLFNANERAQATNAATATTQLAGAVGLGGGSESLSTPGAPSPKYTVYAALRGMAYTPVSTAPTILVSVGAPVGFSLDSNGHTPLTPAEAADRIDALTGAPPDGARLGGVLSSLQSAWDEIKGTAARVTQVLVSAGSEVYVGIQYVVNGVTKVVKAIVNDIKDAAAAIGTFFVQLGKLLLKVVEALSLLLHWEQILKTHAVVKDCFHRMTARLPTDLAHGFPNLDGYLGDLKVHAEATFGKLIAQLQQGAPSSTPGVPAANWGQLTGGRTAHDAMTVAPLSAPTKPQSVAVQGMWGMHTVRQNKDGVSSPTPPAAQSSDPIVQALAGFLGDGAALSASLRPILGQFHAGLHLDSPQDILRMAIADLLTLAEAAVVAGIDTLQQLVDAMEGVVAQLVQALDGGGEITIPVISALWKKLGLPPLTALDLVSFVVAIPATFVYRVLTGRWLGDDVTPPGAGVDTSVPAALGDAFGIISTMIAVAAGVFTSINDTIYVVSEGESSIIARVWAPIVNYAVIGLLAVGPIYAAATNKTDPAYWVTVGLTMIGSAVTAFSSRVGGAEAAPIWTMVGWLLAIGVLVAQYEGDTATNQLPEAVIADVLANVPGVVGVVKLIADPAAIIPFAAPVADLGCLVASAGLTLTATIENWNTTPDGPGPAPTPSPSASPTPLPGPSRWRRFLPAIRR